MKKTIGSERVNLRLGVEVSLIFFYAWDLETGTNSEKTKMYSIEYK